MKTTSAIIGNLFTGLLGRVIGSLGPIFLVPLMVRAWGLETYGEWLLLTAIPSYIMLSPDFGLAGAVINEMATLTAREKLNQAASLYRTAWLVLLVSATFFFWIGFGLAWYIDWSRIGVFNLSVSASAAIIIYSCAQILAKQQAFLLSGIYKSACQNPRYGLLQSMEAALLLIIGAMTLIISKDPVTYISLQAFASFLFLVVLFADSRRVMPGFTLGFKDVSLRRILPYITPGLGHAVMPLIHALQNQGVLIVLGIMLGPVSVALFQTTRILSNGVKSLLGLTTSAVMVEIPTLLGKGKNAIVQRLLVRNAQVGISIAIVGIGVLIIFGKTIYATWLGSDADYPEILAFMLFLSIVPFSLGSSFTILLLSANQVHRAIPLTLVFTLLSVGLVFVGASVNALSGVGMAILIWEIGIASIFMLYAAKCLSWSLRQYFKMMFSFNSTVADCVYVRNRIFKKNSL